MEGVTLGMNYGLRRLAELGVKPTQIRATGGGAKSKVWRQIMADIFNAEVVTLKVSEGAAYGAALQALWCWRLQQGEKISINDITDQFVEVNKAETAAAERQKTSKAIANCKRCRTKCLSLCATFSRSTGNSSCADMSDDSERIDKLESHVTDLERQIEQLNEVIVGHSRELERLKKQIGRLSESVESAELERIKSADAKPPHYQ